MATLRNKRNNSMPSLNMNKFFVSKRASMFEAFDEVPREKRDRSPCGVLEISERKLEARKERERKEASMGARKKRQSDPYREESTEMDEDEQLGIVGKSIGGDTNKNESKVCRHANRAVNPGLVRRSFKQGAPVGECTLCRRAKDALGNFCSLNVDVESDAKKSYDPVVWLCCYCGSQGCDRNSRDKHSYHHYKTPRSDLHCLVLNTQSWTVWCYECDSEVVLTCSKKLHEIVNFVKRQGEMAPKRSVNSILATNRQHTTNLTTQYSGSDSRLHLSSRNYEDNHKTTKNNKNYQASVLAALPKVKGITNLGNTCFFNSVMQSLSQTHFLTQLFDLQIQKGQKVLLPGRQKWPLPSEDDRHKKNWDKCINGENRDSSESEPETEDNIELKPLDLYLTEGGALSSSFGTILKEMHCVGKSSIVNPGHIFGLICKKSTQFQGYRQQDAHELLRCLLDAIRNEEMTRMKRSILKSFGYNEKTDPNSVPARMKKVIKGYGKQTTHTVIDEIFGGQLISTVFCEECHWSSQVFEPFMDLSLPVNEEKGKPKKSNSFDDDGPLDSVGHRLSDNTSLSNNTLSKYQQKRQKKSQRRSKRNNKNTINNNDNNEKNEINLPHIKVNNSDKDDNNTKEHKKKRRLTEQRRPEDMEEYRLKEEAEKKIREERKKMVEIKKKGGESSKFKMLVQTRSASRKDIGEDAEGGESGEEEEQEYDPDEEDEEDNSFGIESRGLKNKDTKEELEKNDNNNRMDGYNNNNNKNNNCNSKCKDSVDSEGVGREEVEEEENEGDEEEEEDEMEEEGEEEEEETGDNESSSICSSIRNSKTIHTSSPENSDADVEDNTDSEYIRNSFRQNTRQPSIVVDESVSDPLSTELVGNDNRYLMTSNSCDHLNYNSASDTSERYFTAAGADTMDELDHHAIGDLPPGLSNVDMFSHCDDKADRQAYLDEMCLKVGELKIRRRSEDEELLVKKSHTIKKLKQEWISRSLATLSPRYQSGRQECSVESCLASFTSPELLTGNNKINCENCSKLRSHVNDGPESSKSIKSNASKRLLIFSPPAVLTLHLKRFHHAGFNLTKVNRFVQFPMVIDLAPFTSSISLGLNNMNRQSQVLYMLYGVVEHTGRLNSGHYVSYVRSRPLDSSRTSKQFLNVKPSSQFELNQLVSDMVTKVEAEGGPLNKVLKPSLSQSCVNLEEIEDEVKRGRWYHVSDTYVAEVNFEKVAKAQAYLLFYERIL